MSGLSNIPAGIRKEEIFKNTVEDPRVRRFMTPQRVLWKSEGVTGEEALLQPTEKQIHFNVPKLAVLKSTDEPASILLDFGVEFHGYVKLYIHDVSPVRVKIRVRFGESAEEAMADLGGKKNATNDHIDRDQILDVGFLSMPEIGPSGFRFVRIDLLEPNATITFQAVSGIFVYRPLEYKGSFNSSDELLNKIWNTAAYTVHLNMQEYVWDGIKRDRLVWIGDIHPETSTIQAVFGYDDSVEKSLDLARNESPIPNVMCGISGYSMWWVLVHYGWYMQNGRIDYLREQEQYLKELLKFFSEHISEDGREQLPPGRLLDWPTSGNEEAEHAGYQSLLALVFERGAFLLEELGNKELAEFYREKSAFLKKHIPDPNGNKQAAALMILSGIADKEKARDLSDNLIKVDGAHRISTFLGFYVLEALSETGDTEAALNMIRDFWGAMLSRGATTFWEDFNLDWLEGSGRIDELVPEGTKDLHGDYGAYCYIGFRHSLCHGWASGPAAYLSRYVLGIKPIAPGCKKVLVRPNLGDLKFVEGTYPTPYGIIKVRHEKAADGTVKSVIEAPKEVEVVR